MQRWFIDSGAVLVLAVLLSHSNNIASGFLSPFVATKGRPISVTTGVRAPLYSRLFMGRKIEEEEETLSTAKVTKKNKKKASGKKNVTQSKKEAAKPTVALSEQEADAAAAGISISATTASTKTTTTATMTNANVNTDPALNSGNSINIDSVLSESPSVSATPPVTTTATETEEEGLGMEAPAIASRKVFPSATDGFVDASVSTRSSNGGSSTVKKTKTNNKSDSSNNNNRGGRDDVIDTDLVNMRVPRNDPLRQSIVPPEVVFFGEPRNPPPPEAVGDLRYHGSLLYWARHATVAPRTSEERLSCVFPKGRLHPESPKYRLIKTTTAATTSSSSPSVQQQQLELTYEKVLAAFEGVMEDLEASKAFVDSNIDLVPPKLFLRVLTTEKLAAQAKNDLERMDHLKDVRRKYILASDQVFFPLNIEVQKAETRVMSYLARDELRNFASIWDEVESTLHFAVLLAARLTWDGRVKEVLDDIKKKIENTVGYMADGIRRDLMSREFRKPGITAEVYLNASITIQERMPELYAKVAPEVQFLHETYFMTQKENAGELLISYLTTDFCPKRNISPDQIKERLKILDATVAAIQGTDYVRLRLLIQEVFQLISTKEEKLAADHWYFERQNRKGYGFDTYEPDEIPQLIQYEQRIRETGNAFKDFAVGVLKAPTSYTDAFSGSRKKGSQVGNWLERDPDWNTPDPDSYEARMAEFQQAYAVQTQLRKEAEGKLNRMVRDRMDRQDRVLMGASNDNDENNDASAFRGMFEKKEGGGASVIDLTDSEMEEAE